jgi:hypothetical protein
MNSAVPQTAVLNYIERLRKAGYSDGFLLHSRNTANRSPMDRAHSLQWRTQEFCSVRGSGSSCNLLQEISFHIVNFP